MVWLLRKCEKCSRYTLKKDECPFRIKLLEDIVKDRFDVDNYVYSKKKIGCDIRMKECVGEDVCPIMKK